MKKFRYLGAPNKKSNYIVWIADALVDVKLNGKDIQTASTRAIRLYTMQDGKDGDILEVKEENMEPMVGSDGKVIVGFYWLKA